MHDKISVSRFRFFVTSIHPQPLHLAVSQVIDLLADVGDVRFRLVVYGTAGDVAIGLGQTQDGAFETDVNRVGQGGMVHLRIVAVDLIHPALRDCGGRWGKSFH